MSRVYGPDLMLEICRLSIGSGISHFFYGGAPGVAERLAGRLSVRFPGLRVAGWHCPPFRELTSIELEEVVARVNGVSPDVVWVGLGTPRQERWATAVRSRLRAKVLATVGAAFDFHSGRLRQAPPLLRRAGLEWAYRLAQEPSRLWRRYLRNNPLFVILAGAELLGVTRLRNTDQTESRASS
jgi:N-acetylglucosaminyldiphosphoundecaprenol N-acetyl-beta-D-mannosaminyltransferase